MTPLQLEIRRSLASLGRQGGPDAPLVALIVQTVALWRQVQPEEIAAPTRHCARVARARQIAMYLAHTAYQWPLARVASAFGRDRSTASHACRRVEDLRDDARFDAELTRWEGWLREAPVAAGSAGSCV